MNGIQENGAAPNDSAAPIDEWAERFNRDGYLLLHDILPLDLVEELKTDLDRALESDEAIFNKHLELRMRMFEISAANVRLFDWEPIATLAEKLIAPDCHVIHNNSFRTPTGSGITQWHQDDPPHLIVTSGEPPTNIHLPVLAFTCNYFLTDLDEIENGPTQVIPGSHLFGAPCPHDIGSTPHAKNIVSCLGKAGSVVLFNNQVWHRGAPNTSSRTRVMTQITYARRFVGHKYFPFMNYQMPEHVYAGANPRLKRLLGFLPTGNYG